MLDPCKEREPRVITNALIEKCIDLQYPKGEVGRLLRLEGIPMEEVKEIRFEHLYILKIDHLWVLRSLVKLSLNSNLIEKIEGLETLIHLKELDLSFNKIQKIENLETLTNLEKISFYENLIETIDNLDNQQKMTVFSIGKNKIDDHSNVNYFRKFKALTSLNMAENPCAEEEYFRYYVAAFLPNLVYYEYKRIDEKERGRGSELFRDELRTLERKEEKERIENEQIEKEAQDAKSHSKMFVEHLQTGKLFDIMYTNDEEGKTLLELGEEVRELYDEYKNQFVEHCKEVFDIGEKHYHERQTELDNFTRSSENAKLENQLESIGHIENFLENKNAMFNNIKNLQQQLDHDVIDEDQFMAAMVDHRQDFEQMIHKTWKNLMELELRIFEQIEEVNQTIERVLAEMLNTFKEEVQAVFTNIRAAEVAYSENLNEAGIQFLTNMATMTDDEEISKELKEMVYDRDSLNNAIVATHDVHMQAIDSREDLLNIRCKAWIEDLVNKMKNEEILRNRYKLLEINHFLDIQQEEFNEITSLPEHIVRDEDEL